MIQFQYRFREDWTVIHMRGASDESNHKKACEYDSDRLFAEVFLQISAQNERKRGRIIEV